MKFSEIIYSRAENELKNRREKAERLASMRRKEFIASNPGLIDIENEMKKCKKVGINTFATVPDRDAENMVTVDFSKGGMCIIGNEGNGVSKEIIKKCNHRITIKMDGRAEALNASAAASIVMWEMAR